MIKVKIAELESSALDWAVATCEGGEGLWFDTVSTYWVNIDGKERALSKGWAQSFTPSTDWSQGGPIIERVGIELNMVGIRTWRAKTVSLGRLYEGVSTSPLIAAMRCYVASKLGDEVEILKELTQC